MGTYFAVLASVLGVGLAMGVSMPLVSLRLAGWGYGSFAIGIMAAMPAVGVLLGAALASRLAARFGTANLMRLCLWAGAVSVGALALLPYYWIWLVLRLTLGVILTIVFVLGESWINQLVIEAPARASGGAVWQHLRIEPAGRSVAAGRDRHPGRLWFLDWRSAAGRLTVSAAGAYRCAIDRILQRDVCRSVRLLSRHACDRLGGRAVCCVRSADPHPVAALLHTPRLHPGNRPDHGQRGGGG